MDLMRGRVYTERMRMLALVALLVTTQPAIAMNWEGHDDWMIEFPPVQPFIDAVPSAKLPTPRGCPIGPIISSDNPYEQIPLPQRHCPVPMPGKLPGN